MCQAGYYVDNTTNKCSVLSQWCDTYEMIGGKCNKCKFGAIMQNGLCVKPIIGIDPYCSRYDGAYCVACMDMYKLDNYVCKKAWSFITINYHLCLLLLHFFLNFELKEKTSNILTNI